MEGREGREGKEGGREGMRGGREGGEGSREGGRGPSEDRVPSLPPALPQCLLYFLKLNFRKYPAIHVNNIAILPLRHA